MRAGLRLARVGEAPRPAAPTLTEQQLAEIVAKELEQLRLRQAHYLLARLHREVPRC